MMHNSSCCRRLGGEGSLRRRPKCATILLGCFAFLFGCNPLWAQAPTDSEDFRQASEAMRNGNLNQAAEGFASVIKQNPTFAEAHFNLGLVREEQGRHQEAIASFQKALSLKSGLRGANLFLGVAEYRLNQLDKAIAAVRQETIAYPKDAGALMWLGVIELAKDRPEEAADVLDKAAKIVGLANGRCDQENVIEQLKNGVNAMRMPVDDLLSNWAYMVMAASAWNLKAWYGLLTPNRERGLELVKMEFRRFLHAIILLPCQIVRTARRVIYRILGYNSWLKDFFATWERLQQLVLIE